MAWETRGRQTYYYRSHREGPRVRKEYIGRGLLAEGAELRDQCRREREREEREEREAEREPIETALMVLDQFDAAVDLLMKAVLHASGYHSPNRSKIRWRKRRDEALT